MNLEWTQPQKISRHSEATFPISLVYYKEGYLLRIEYLLDKDTWLIEILNGLIRVTRDRKITQMEEVKELAEQLLRSALKATIADNNIKYLQMEC